MLKWFGSKIAGHFERKAILVGRDCAEHLAARARAHVPIDTGELFESIGVVPTVAAKVNTVVATADHASPVEFGHLAGSTWVAPQPFMRNAVAETKAAFPKIAKAARVRRTTPDEKTGPIEVQIG